MFNSLSIKGLRTFGLGVIAAAAIAAPAVSSAANHFAGGGYHGNFAARGGYAVRGYGGYGGYRGYYGRGFYGGYGYRGWGYGGCCWWGWPTGLFLATLPLYYSTWWWNGVPYYYADNSYYVWDAPGSRYEQVAPPSGLLSNGAPSPGGTSGGTMPADLFAYPKNGQSTEQQARDRQECRDWAAGQTGGAASAQGSDANGRAQTACLEARGYSVR
jgi:hypothetical protein